MAQGWALEDLDSFVGSTQVHFASAVEQKVTKTVSFSFPNETEASTTGEIYIHRGDFKVSVEGPDCRMFSAQIREKNILSGSCKVLITYLPMTEGPHEATLKILHQCDKGCTKTVLLTGETSEDNRDPLSPRTNGLLGDLDGSISGSDSLNDEDTGSNFNPFNDGVDAVIEVTPSSLDFGNTMVGYSANKSFLVKGENLSGPLSLTVATSRSDDSDVFTIDRTSISADQAAKGVIVKVTYQPISVGTLNSTSICISGGGAESKSISLCGTAVEGVLPITIFPASLSFSGVEVGNTETKEFTVTVPVANVTDLIKLQPILNDDSGMFSISQQSFTALEAVNGVKVKVTYQPTVAGKHNASVVISGNGVESQTVNLQGATFAEYSTILVTSDDVTMECLIDQNSNIKIEKPNLVIRTRDQVLTYDLDKMTQMRYGQRVITGDTGQETLKAGSIIMHGLKENTIIEVTDSDGRVVMRKSGSENSNVMLSLDDEPSGEYKISTASQTIKIVKQ